MPLNEQLTDKMTQNKPRPKPLQIVPTRHDEGEDIPNEMRFENFFNPEQNGGRQIPGNINPDDLQLMGELGKGNSGYVTKVKYLPGNLVLARKVIRLEVNAFERNRIMQELQVLMDCNSPYIVGYFGACPRQGEINLFMEYMDGRSLDSILTKTTRIQEDILGKITISVIKGLTYLRDKLSIMHRDIKPSNILVNSSGQIKLCDFGVSGHLIDSIAQTFVGTKQYMSPERLTGQNYDLRSDIWSLGLTLVELALGKYPIPQHDPLKMYENPAPSNLQMPIFELMSCIVNEPPPTIPGSPIFTEEFKEFVDRCLKKLPEDRFDLRSIVTHKFIEVSERSQVDVAAWVCKICSGSIASSGQD